jgi:hypothetical protein
MKHLQNVWLAVRINEYDSETHRPSQRTIPLIEVREQLNDHVTALQSAENAVQTAKLELVEAIKRHILR